MTRILVVDDEEGIRDGFEKALRKDESYLVVTASSGGEALAKLEAEPFDLVFTDMRMPGIDGLEVVRRGRELRPQAGFVLMTGYSSVGSAVDAMKYGAIEYLEKPFTVEELASHVAKVKGLRDAAVQREEEARGFERFTRRMRFQHLILIVTFTLLTITGVPLLFPNTFKGVFFFEDSSFLRGLTHRIAAIGLILGSVYHVFWLLSEEGHRNLRSMLPRLPQDVKQVFGEILFNLGLRKTKPPAGKYDWIEKFEYFALVWGTAVMVASGLVLWFTDAVLRVAPLWIIDLAKVVHRYEAILAILSIYIWHMYTVHFRPGVFPMSRVWLDGRISREHMIHDHALEYEELTGRPAHTPAHVDGDGHPGEATP